MSDLSVERRRRLQRRALPALAALAVLATASGLMVGSLGQSDTERTAGDFTQAWERRDFRAMYGLLDDASRRAHSLPDFRRAYRDAAATATALRLSLIHI